MNLFDMPERGPSLGHSAVLCSVIQDLKSILSIFAFSKETGWSRDLDLDSSGERQNFVPAPGADARSTAFREPCGSGGV